MENSSENKRFCPDCQIIIDKLICPKCGIPSIKDRTGMKKSLDTLVNRLIHDKYKIKSVLGKGGMGKVYLGIHISINQKVAVKVLRRELIETNENVMRFFQEAKAASMLTHPHTIRVFDFGETKDDYL